MTTVDELILKLEPAIEALQSAIQAASDCWEDPLLEAEGPPLRGQASAAQDAWTPRDAAEHAIYGLALNTAYAAQPFEIRLSATADFSVGWRKRLQAGAIQIPSMASAAPAGAALTEVQTRSFETLRSLLPEQLTQPVEFMPAQIDYLAQRGVRNGSDVGSSLRLSVAHLHDHADQIQRAVAEL